MQLHLSLLFFRLARSLVWPGSVRIVVVRGDGTDIVISRGRPLPEKCFPVASAGASAIIDSVGESAIDSSAGGVGSSSSS